MSFEKEIKFLQLQVSDILRKIKAKSTSWGQLLGDIRNQKDLMRYFGLKQDLLKSGKNIKTINGSSLLGSGDLQVNSLTNPITGTGTFKSGTSVISTNVPMGSVTAELQESQLQSVETSHEYAKLVLENQGFDVTLDL